MSYRWGSKGKDDGWYIEKEWEERRKKIGLRLKALMVKIFQIPTCGKGGTIPHEISNWDLSARGKELHTPLRMDDWKRSAGR